jgi:anti-repressor protein
MQELVKIGAHRIGVATVQTVNARDLHAFLEVGKDFSTWIKDRIAQFDFNENSDFVLLPEIGEQLYQGVNGRKDYYLSLDMAKELSMVERNERGKEARRYFIECERVAKAPPSIDLRNPATLATIAIQLIDVNKELSAKVEELTPKAEVHDRIADAHGTFNRTTAAKMLGVAPHTLIRWMRTNGWIYRRPGNADDIAYQSKIEAGLLEHKIQTGPRPDGTEWSSTAVRVTPKGLTVLAKAFPPAAALAG